MSAANDTGFLPPGWVQTTSRLLSYGCTGLGFRTLRPRAPELPTPSATPWPIRSEPPEPFKDRTQFRV